jgi:hypothetical protein
VVLALGAAATAPDWGVRFVDVAERAGLRAASVYGGVDRKRFIIETNGAGVAWMDYDDDGKLDALVLSGTRLPETQAAGEPPTNRLYRNKGDGTFADVTDAAGLRHTGWASGVCAGDFDNDGRLDMLVTYYGQNVLYRNRGGTFEDITARAGLPTGGVRWGSGCSFVDYDRDGRLDLFVSNYLSFDMAKAAEPGGGANCVWKGIPVNCGPKGLPTDTNLLFHNDGDGKFTDVSLKSRIAGVTNRYPMTAAAADFDEDGWPDIYVACDTTPSILYRNNHDGTFTDVALASGAAYGEYGNVQAGMGLAVGDYDRDGRLDILKTHFADDVPALYRALGKGLFEDTASQTGLAVQNRHVEWGAGMPDLDNDGWPDVVYITGHVYPEIEQHLPQYPHRGPRMVFQGQGGTRFADVSRESGPGATTPHSSRGAAFGDYDEDGDLDVLVMNMNEPPSLLRNEVKNANHWLKVKLVGVQSNRAGIGATVVVTASGRRQAQAVLSQTSYYSHDDVRLHFGLGAARSADAVEVRWPNGGVDVIKDVAADRMVTVREGTGR